MCAEAKKEECGCGEQTGRHGRNMRDICGEHMGQHGHHVGGGCGIAGMSNRFMRPYILLLLAEEPAHGYELIGRLTSFGIDQSSTDPSILYRVLRMMESEGLLTSKLDPTGSGPARKVYELTDEGYEVLDMWAAKLGEMSAFFGKFAKRYSKLSRT